MSDAYANGTDVPSVPRSVCQECERLDWIERNLIEGKWDGTIGRPKSWHMAGPYRHTLQTLRGNTLREAIDAALAADQPAAVHPLVVDGVRHASNCRLFAYWNGRDEPEKCSCGATADKSPGVVCECCGAVIVKAESGRVTCANGCNYDVAETT